MAVQFDMFVKMRYNGPKAREFYPSNQSAAIAIVKEDLKALKIPFPKTDTITITSQGECSFMWPNVVIDSLLYKQLTSRIWGRVDDERKDLYRSLSIDRLYLHEKRLYPPKVFPHKQWRRPNVEEPQQQHRNEAQLLLDDMASALRIPKNEPVEIPTFLRQAIDVDTTPPGLTFSTQTTRTRPSRFSEIDTQLPRKRSHSPDLWERPARPPPSSADTSAFVLAERAHNVLRPPPASAPGAVGKGPGGAARERHKDHHALLKLSRELHNARRQIAANAAREDAILAELAKLDPGNDKYYHDVMGNNSSTQVNELRQVEAKESAMRARLKEVELELAEEKSRRAVAEAALEDMKRECKEPFVVSAMLEAFLMISKATTEALEPVKHR
ncbi:hypothetical protein H0H81_003017 [Sphagnurus paluster]|uniref:Uncharacterized protein n=1 Tax=Sphagnurus paluster TaxID=117069 RepID=A0A9P7GMU5_9AGAR|nr:hypothetical protein H0H81_003017 [Sphagnurus paluster]